MKKLQIKLAEGWLYVAGRRMPEKTVLITADKAKALPTKAFWGEDDLAWAKKEWPDRSFRLAERLDD